MLVYVSNNSPLAHAEFKDKPFSSPGCLQQAAQILMALNTPTWASVELLTD